MKKYKDETGNRYGRLLVLERTDNSPRGIAMWLCRCDCGQIVAARGDHLRSGATQSCGCYMRDKAKETSQKHDGTKTRLYRIWCNMKNRCYNAKVKSYADYGARGIVVCDEWLYSFEVFRDWSLANGYQDDLTLDRIDTNGNYEPSNCKWSTMLEQQSNRRNNTILPFNGQHKTISQWSRELGISEGTLRSRIDCGWSVERALTEKIHTKHRRNHHA